MFVNKENRLLNLDGEEIWHSRSCCTSIMVFCRKDDKTLVLMNKRGSEMTNPYKWCLPCGYMDWDENGFNAARRELWEECGVFIPEIKGKSPWYVDTEPNGKLQNITLHYDYEIDSIVETTNENCGEGEVIEIKWFDINDILSMPEDVFAFGHKSLIGSRISMW